MKEELRFKYYVLNYNHNKNVIEPFNVFNNYWVNERSKKEIAKYIRSPKNYITRSTQMGFDGLCEEIRHIIQWQEWGRVEYEISVGRPFCDDANELRKIDCYEQCKPNIEMITRELIYQYKAWKKERKNERPEEN